MKNTFLISLIIFIVFGSCTNQDWEFPDNEFQSVYFAYQYPVRTITLGDDQFDTTLDNLWRCKIMATTAGIYSNDNDIIIDFVVDNTLAENLRFGAAGGNIIPMPSNYYTLSSNNQIIIPAGSIIGGVTVQLTADFFADPASIRNTYVIPIRMTGVVNADTILRGRVADGVVNPRRAIGEDWAVQPKDFILYAVRFVNPWHGFYLRRGQDVVSGLLTGRDTTIVRANEFVERDEVISLTTQSLSDVLFPIQLRNRVGVNTPLELVLSFDANGNAVVSDNSELIVATGTGRFVSRGEKNSWGRQDRDAIYLNYQVEFDGMTFATADTLVLRNRGVHMEVFTPVVAP